MIVGLVDGMIAQARVVAGYLRRNEPAGGIADALADLRSDEDVALLTTSPITTD